MTYLVLSRGDMIRSSKTTIAAYKYGVGGLRIKQLAVAEVVIVTDIAPYKNVQYSRSFPELK